MNILYDIRVLQISSERYLGVFSGFTYTMKKNNLTIKIIALALTMSFSTITVFAVVLNSLSDTMSSVKVNNLSNHDFSFITPTGIASGGTVILTFPGAFSIPAGLSYTDVDVLDNGVDLTLAALPTGSTAGIENTSTKVLTFTNGTTVIGGGDTVRIKIGTNASNQSVGVYQITNDSSVGNRSIGITGSFGDTGTTTVNLLTDDNVQINAVVPQSFTFSISTNAINFGDLTINNAKYASSSNVLGDETDTVAHTLTIASNATAGYTITVRGQTLTSQQKSTDTITQIGSAPAASSAGSEQFGIYAEISGGVGGTIDTTYATPSQFGYDATATTSAMFASGSYSSGLTTYSLHYLANVSSVTEAGTYSTGLIYVGTSNF